MKSFKPEDDPGDPDDGPGGNAERDFRGQKRSNQTHASTTDPDARLYKKARGQPSRLCFVGTALMENRNGLVVDGRLTRASGVSECLSAVDLTDQHIPQGGTLAGDKGFDTADLVAELRDRRITSPRTPTTPARPSGAPISTGAPPATTAMRQARNAANGSRRSSAGSKPSPPGAIRGLDRTAHGFHLALAADNLARMPKLLVTEAG